MIRDGLRDAYKIFAPEKSKFYCFHSLSICGSISSHYHIKVIKHPHIYFYQERFLPREEGTAELSGLHIQKTFILCFSFIIFYIIIYNIVSNTSVRNCAGWIKVNFFRRGAKIMPNCVKLNIMTYFPPFFSHFCLFPLFF